MSTYEKFEVKNSLRIRVLYEQLSDTWLQKHKEDEELLKISYRNMGNAIYDFGNVWTGFISKAAVERIVITKQPPQILCTFDHFYGRMNSGEAIVQSFLNDSPTIEQFTDLLFTHCKVHRILKEENHAVSVYQNNRGMSWQGAYNAANIQLVEIPMGERKRLTSSLIKQHEYKPPTPLAQISL